MFRPLLSRFFLVLYCTVNGELSFPSLRAKRARGTKPTKCPLADRAAAWVEGLALREQVEHSQYLKTLFPCTCGIQRDDSGPICHTIVYHPL